MNAETKALHMHMEKCKLQFGIYEDGGGNGKRGIWEGNTIAH